MKNSGLVFPCPDGIIPVIFSDDDDDDDDDDDEQGVSYFITSEMHGIFRFHETMHFVSVSNRIPRAGCFWGVFFQEQFSERKSVSFHKANDVRVLGKEVIFVGIWVVSEIRLTS